ncbi:MAG: type I methionyl aminopeptidase [Deltaproteobacteria bacterium]|nr:MAG: type I methionyl aminopeptidase [Deltaproteobacteria bacterium]
MIVIKNPDEIEIMHEANQIVAEVLTNLEKVAEPGISTWELDKISEELCLKRGAVPAFKNYRGFPASLCVSINEEVVHGIPSRKRKLRKGDIVSVDFGTKLRGYHGDSAITIPVGGVDSKTRKLLKITEESLYCGIDQVRAGNRICDISAAVQRHVESHGLSVVRQFVGHGIGSDLHEEPEVPNFVQDGFSPRLKEGMVIAIEPMVNLGTHEVKVLKDGWTVVTADRKFSAHFEHTVAVTSGEPRILSSREGGIA